MNTSLNRLALFFCLVLTLVISQPSVASPAQMDSSSEVIRLGIDPRQSPKTILAMYAPLAASLEKKLGKKIRIFSAPDTRTFLARARQGGYDLLLVDPAVFSRLQSAKYRVIAKAEASFYDAVIVRNDSPLTAIEQLRGKRVAVAGDEFSGDHRFVLPLLTARGVDPQKEVTFLFPGGKDIILYGVLNRKYDAGVMNLDTLELPAFAGIRDQIRILIRSSEMSQFPILAIKNMELSVVTAIQQALTVLSPARPEDLTILNSMQVEKISLATDADFDQHHVQIKATEGIRPL